LQRPPLQVEIRVRQRRGDCEVDRRRKENDQERKTLSSSPEVSYREAEWDRCKKLAHLVGISEKI